MAAIVGEIRPVLAPVDDKSSDFFVDQDLWSLVNKCVKERFSGLATAAMYWCDYLSALPDLSKNDAKLYKAISSKLEIFGGWGYTWAAISCAEDAVSKCSLAVNSLNQEGMTGKTATALRKASVGLADEAWLIGVAADFLSTTKIVDLVLDKLLLGAALTFFEIYSSGMTLINKAIKVLRFDDSADAVAVARHNKRLSQIATQIVNLAWAVLAGTNLVFASALTPMMMALFATALVATKIMQFFMKHQYDVARAEFMQSKAIQKAGE